MLDLLVGLTLFVAVAGIANLLPIAKYTYTSNPILFLTFFLCITSFAIWFGGYKISLATTVFLVVVAIVYVTVVSSMVRFWRPMNYLYGAQNLPKQYEGIVRPKYTGQTVKAVEVGIQDLCAWLIVGGLLATTSSFAITILIFTTVVFLLHLPGLWLFGRVYGMYFLLTSTGLAFLVPVLYQLESLGFVLLYMLHMGGYILMYVLMGVWGDCRTKEI